MSRLVIDASIAMKWVVDEERTADALALRAAHDLVAPDLLVPECANVLWKKVLRGELTRDEARLAARLLQGADVELMPTRALLEAAMVLAIELNHPAYDCLYLALAADQDCAFVTSDGSFVRKVHQQGRPALRGRVSALGDMSAR